MSDEFAADGLASGEALRRAMFFGLGALAIAIVLLLAALPHLGREEASRIERARAAGEPLA
jgi:hypothetical protein